MGLDAPVRTGLDVLKQQAFRLLRGLRIGLVTHPAAVDSKLRSAYEVLSEAPGVKLAAVFGPEHGFLGDTQDLVAVRANRHQDSGCSFHSLYGETLDSLRPTEEQLRGLDALVIDLQDVGSRYYTFQATMLLCLEAASAQKLLTVILDRPNPLGGAAVEGPLLQPGYESFVGPHPIVTRHGMTLGELARMYMAERPTGRRGQPGGSSLEVIPCEGWRREMIFDQTGLPWVMPSPNMPTLETAFVYPGQCLLEGGNVSEGRGTTRPFELCGAPWLDSRKVCQRLSEEALPGVAFRPVWFQPTFHKFAGQTCGGLQLHVLDRHAFQPVRTGLAVLMAMRELSGDRFDWRREPYEFVTDRLAIDLLFGSDRERQAIEAGRSTGEITAAWEAEEEAFRERRKRFLLYS